MFRSVLVTIATTTLIPNLELGTFAFIIYRDSVVFILRPEFEVAVVDNGTNVNFIDKLLVRNVVG